MKETVTIKGISVTREEVQNALKELDASEVVLPFGTKVRMKLTKSVTGVILTGRVQQHYAAAAMNFSPNPRVWIVTVASEDGGYSYASWEQLYTVWEPVPKERGE